MSRAELAAISPELVERAVAGDARAVDSIVRALQGPLYGLARRLLTSPEDAADALQESLLRIVTRLSTFRSESKFSTWAWSVAVHSMLDFRRGTARRARLDFRAFAEDLGQGLDMDAPMRAEDRVFLQQVKVGCGRALLQCLDGDHRVAYVLVDIVGFEPAQGAEICGVAPATFRKRLSRARLRIRDHLRANCGVLDESAPCRCHRRLGTARRLGRLEADDGMDVTVAQLTARVRTLNTDIDRLEATAEFFRRDQLGAPHTDPLTEIRKALGLAPGETSSTMN